MVCIRVEDVEGGGGCAETELPFLLPLCNGLACMHARWKQARCVGVGVYGGNGRVGGRMGREDCLGAGERKD